MSRRVAAAAAFQPRWISLARWMKKIKKYVNWISFQSKIHLMKLEHFTTLCEKPSDTIQLILKKLAICVFIFWFCSYSLQHIIQWINWIKRHGSFFCQTQSHATIKIRPINIEKYI
jgi:hypothetical protein